MRTFSDMTTDPSSNTSNTPNTPDRHDRGAPRTLADTVLGRLARGASQSPVFLFAPVFVLVLALVLTAPWPLSLAAPEAGSEIGSGGGNASGSDAGSAAGDENAGDLYLQDFAKPEEMERMLQELRLRSPLPGEEERTGPADLDFRISPMADDAAPVDQEPESAGPPAGSSSYRAKIVQRGPAELFLVDDLVFEKGVGEQSVLLSPMVTGKPVLGSSLSYAVVSEDAEDATSIPQGLYLFDEQGRQKHFLGVPDTKHVQAVYLSPDRVILAVDIGIGVNHVLHLYDYASLMELEKSIRYYPDSRLLARVQREEMERRAALAAEAKAEERALAEGKPYRKRAASQKTATRSHNRQRDVFEAGPLAWFNGHTLVYRILDPDTARPCNYEPCGVISIRSYSPDTEVERLLCSGTELCDCQLIGLKASTRGRDGMARVGMQCTRNISEWRELGNKKTTVTLDMPVQ